MGISLPRAIASWSSSLLEEVVRAPETLRVMRTTLGDLARLPRQLDELAVLLERTTGTLDEAMAELSRLVGGQMQQTLGHLDEAVSELRDTLNGLIGVIPGARRALSGSLPKATREPS